MYKYAGGLIVVDSICFISFTVTLLNPVTVSSSRLLIILKTSDSEMFELKISSNEGSHNILCS